MIVEENLNISHTVNIPRKDGKVIIEVQIDESIDLPALKEKFEANGIQVEEIARTSAKVL
ncbi:CBS domain containing protein [Streptococcus pneumoniae]|nr:CBS domain containing protein [Streptococcus pneumoniae]CIW22235.1 CBS domain containing protein [Streptococcus pneumoniae]CMW18980.1 CBS domain containing protein [Streptococcus pneumoniae]